MVTIELKKHKLNFGEALIICPHCKAELIKKIEIRATGESSSVAYRDRCPKCWKLLDNAPEQQKDINQQISDILHKHRQEEERRFAPIQTLIRQGCEFDVVEYSEKGMKIKVKKERDLIGRMQ